MIRKSPGSSKKTSRSPTITTSTSRNSAVPVSPYRSAENVVNFFQARSGVPAGTSSFSSGIGKQFTSARMPSRSSVRQTKRNVPPRCRRTMAYRRFTYSGPYLVPHFMQMTLRRGEVAGGVGVVMASGLDALLDRGLRLGFGPFHLAARREPLVAQHAQGLDLGALATAFAVFEHLEVARSRHAVLVDHFFLFGLRPPQHQQLTDMLDGSGTQFIGQRLVNLAPRGAIIRENAHLDQPVCVQGGVGFLFDGRRQAARANHDDRVQVMGVGAMRLALGGGELNFGHARIIEAV